MPTRKRAIVSNPLDSAALLRDLHRRDECEYLFERIADVRNRLPGVAPGDTEATAKKEGYLAAVGMVMDIIDGRIQQLQDKWD